MDIQFGLETEIGITRERAEDLDVVAESMALVRSATFPGVRMCWDYSAEDPHMDARGFRVKRLLQDVDEANYVSEDLQRALSWSEMKSDVLLKNGARFYNDHAHPEYCTPECSTILELLQQDNAGDSLLMACAREISLTSDNPVLLYKNNTDFQGHSYGCHENYLLPRQLAWETISDGIQAFLVTRQIFAGAGKYGWEEEDRFVQPGFQISQRSDFFSELQSVDTMQRRPLVNTRDEPHADVEHYRRFHVIIGDANLSPYATYLKVGTTVLALRAMMNGAPVERFPRLADPLGSVKAISRDDTWKWRCRLAGGRETTAIEIQRGYVSLVREFCKPLESDWKAVLAAWEQVLDDLERNPLSTADRLDWSAKHRLVEQFRTAEKLEAADPWLRSLDLAYHLLDREHGLFHGLVEHGSLQLPYPLHALHGHGGLPPLTTRAALRGRCIEKFSGAVESIHWGSICLRGVQGRVELDLGDVFDPDLIGRSLRVIDAARSVEDLAQLPFAKIVQ